MRASVYFALVCRQNELSALDGELRTFLTAEDRRYDDGRVLLRTMPQEIEFNDLGEALMRFCQDSGFPRVSKVPRASLMYLQVVPLVRENPLRVYLGLELLSWLVSKGLALDLHSQ